MKLLIVTQKMNKNDPVLGFFHAWVVEFAKRCEHIEVLCLEEGEYDLPANVTVHSMGKEDGVGRLTYLWRFYRCCLTRRHYYDAVFVHMIPQYVLVGAPVWLLMRKRIGLWYAHGAVTWPLKVATKCVRDVFTSTPEGFQITSPKRRIVGQGIDPQHFMATDRVHDRNTVRLVTVGRVAKSKRLETLIHAVALLHKKSIELNFEIVGEPVTEADRQYKKQLETLIADQQLADTVTFTGARTQDELPERLRAADIFIHDGGTNSLDKTLLEALLCGCVVLSSNPAFQSLAKQYGALGTFPPQNATALAELITIASARDDIKASQAALQTHIKQQHTITGLVSNILAHYS